MRCTGEDEDENEEGEPKKGEPKASPDVSWHQRGTAAKGAPALSRADSVVSSSSIGASSISGLSTASTTTTIASEAASVSSTTSTTSTTTSTDNSEDSDSASPASAATSLPDKAGGVGVVDSGNAVAPAAVPELAAPVDSRARPTALGNVPIGPSTPSSRGDSTPKGTKRFSPFKSVSTLESEAEEPTPRATKLYSPFKSVRESVSGLTTPVKLSIQASASAELTSPGIRAQEGTQVGTPIKLAVQATAAIETRKARAEVTSDEDVRGREATVEAGVVEDADATPCPRRMTRSQMKDAGKTLPPKVSTRKTRSSKDAPVPAVLIEERATRTRKASARALQQDP